MLPISILFIFGCRFNFKNEINNKVPNEVLVEKTDCGQNENLYVSNTEFTINQTLNAINIVSEKYDLEYDIGDRYTDCNQYRYFLLNMSNYVIDIDSDSGEIPITCMSYLEYSYISNIMSDHWVAININSNKKMKGTFRLPTFDEWKCYSGEIVLDEHICDVSNIYDLSVNGVLPSYKCNDGFHSLAPVARFKKNKFGLYDIFGNADEILANGDYVGGNFLSHKFESLAEPQKNRSMFPRTLGGVRFVFIEK